MIDDHELLESKGRPIRPGDVLILVRRRGPFVDEIVRALKTRDIGVAGTDRMVLTEQIAVQDLMALGRFALLPDDDLTLAIVLKSPLVGLDEDALYTLAHGRGGSMVGTDPPPNEYNGVCRRPPVSIRHPRASRLYNSI